MMKQPVDYLFPPVTSGQVPYWRLVLRGFSQTCFQSNELTGLLFFFAVLVASPISAAYLLVAGIMAPAGRMIMSGREPAVATGLPGLNPSLIALSIPVFFQTGWTDYGMWGVLIVCVAITIVLVRLCVSFLPIPTLALPFLLVFWGLYALAPQLDMVRFVAASPLPSTVVFEPVEAVVRSMGEAVFSPTVLSGVLFGTGVFLSNWRHGVLAVCGAAIGTIVAYYYSNVDAGSANLGLYGFNGVLTAVSVYVVCGGKLRLAILGALVATILTPAVAALGVQSLSAPFVFTTWLIMALGWIEDTWFDERPDTGSSDTPKPSAQRTPAQKAPSK